MIRAFFLGKDPKKVHLTRGLPGSPEKDASFMLIVYKRVGKIEILVFYCANLKTMNTRIIARMLLCHEGKPNR